MGNFYIVLKNNQIIISLLKCRQNFSRTDCIILWGKARKFFIILRNIRVGVFIIIVICITRWHLLIIHANDHDRVSVSVNGHAPNACVDDHDHDGPDDYEIIV